MFASHRNIEKRLRSLEQHLQHENPVLVTAVRSYRQLDRVGRAMGLLGPEESYATQISWWPMISVLGTFSAGKSTFINHYLGLKLQDTGNQAVDDKFTVICYGREEEGIRALPGLALDADPRFPFYQISEEIEKVSEGEGARVDAYLQLKTCPSERLRGKILIDSPGFDADAQRSAILRITDHIIDLSDLVLVLFDARHPEPGAMEDTLHHLVGKTIGRSDSSKFLYILNQIDMTAREDNPEEVVGAWQRAIAQEGLTAGRFYSIYSPEAAVPIEDDALRRRFEAKRDHDLAEIHARMEQVGIERAYRIIGALETTAREIQEQVVPALQKYIRHWRRLTLWADGAWLALALVLLVGGSIWAGYWDGLRFAPPWWQAFTGNAWLIVAAVVGMGGAAFYLHHLARKFARRRVLRQVEREHPSLPERERMVRAFVRNTRYWRSIFEDRPAGWSRRNRRRLQQLIGDADRYVQALNDRYANPSGAGGSAAGGAGDRPPGPARAQESEPAPTVLPKAESA